jgi:hypothetical protein
MASRAGRRDHAFAGEVSRDATRCDDGEMT